MASLLLWARRAGDIDRLLHGRRSAVSSTAAAAPQNRAQQEMRAMPRCRLKEEAEHRLVLSRRIMKKS